MKSLTEEFIVFRNNAAQRRRFRGVSSVGNGSGLTLEILEDDDANVVLLRNSQEAESPDDAAPSYVGQCEALQYQLGRLEAKVEQLDALHKLHTSRPTLDDEDREEAEIRALTRDVTTV